MDLPENLKNRVRYVARYVLDSTDDWFTVKKELLQVLAPRDRALLSRRHKTSKKHFINDLERDLMIFWERLTSVRLKIDPEKLHTPLDERPPRYWALMELNKQRHETARTKHEKR